MVPCSSAALLLVYHTTAVRERLEAVASSTPGINLQSIPFTALDARLELDHTVLVECCPELEPHLLKLSVATEESSVGLIGLHEDDLAAETLNAFESTCQALVNLGDRSVVHQILQHVRWHTRLLTRDLERGRDAVSQRQVDRRVKHLRPYAEFFRHAPEAMVVVDDAGMILYTNPAARVLAGVSATEGRRSIFDYLKPIEADRARDLAQLLATTPQTTPTDFSIMTNNGMLVVSVHASKMQRSPGSFLLTFRNVTKQRELERTLTHTKDFLQQLIDSSVDAIVSADLQGNILVFNRAAGRIFDYAPDDVVGKLNVRKLYPTGGAESMMRLIRAHERAAGGQLEGHQTQMLDRQGKVVPVRLSAAFVREGRSVVATVGVFTDIRHELELADKLRKAEAELHETEKGVALAQLAGMTAHELNQPLTIILGYSELLQRICTQSDARQAADVLASQAQRLAEIVRRIGRITRYETKGYVGGAAILDLERATRDGTKG